MNIKDFVEVLLDFNHKQVEYVQHMKDTFLWYIMFNLKNQKVQIQVKFKSKLVQQIF